VPEPDDSRDDEETGQPRAFWSGTLSFGLVSIPVDLLPAHRTTRAALRMLDADGTPLARRYFCPEDEKEIDPEHLVRGFELDSGKVVVVTDEELEALAPKKSREIDLRLFVDRDQIDPLYFARSYFLAPGSGSGKAYRLLGAVMERTRRAGIATFVMRDKEYLVAIFAEGGLLRAETLRFEDEVRTTAKVGLPKPAKVDDSALKRLRRSVSALTQKSWNPSELTDPHEALRELAERKLKKKQDVVVAGGSAEGESSTVIDLMEVLRRSLAENDLARGSRAGARARTAPARASQKQDTRKRSTTRKAAGTARRQPSSRARSTTARNNKRKAARRR
jgi:DNA end-binding protein Ku